MLWGFQSHSSVTRGQEPIRLKDSVWCSNVWRTREVQWSNTPVWASCARTIYDHNRGGRIHLPKPPPQINTVECYSSKPAETSTVCWCSGSERFSIEKLLRIHRWHRKTNIKTGWKPKNSVQWAQEAPCPKVSVRYAAGWANCASFWTCW